MERFRVHYWDKDGEAQVAIVEGEDDGGAEAAASIEGMGRLGYIESAPEEPAPDESATRRPRRKKSEG